MIHVLVGTTVVSARHHVCHRVVIVFAEWCIDAYMVTASHHTLRDFIFIYTGAGRQFLYARAALVFLLKSVDFLVYLVERTHLVQRQSHDAALFCYCLEDALANPPYSIGDEFESAGLIEAFCSLDESDVAFVNKIGECESLMLILFCHRHHESQVGFYQFVLGSFANSTSLSYLLCQLYLFLDRDHWRSADLYQIFI